MVAHVEAVKWCGSARGGSQPQIVRCSDKKIYVIKAPNNPHGIRSLANELFASLILQRLGIPTPEPAVVRVNPSMVGQNDEMIVTGYAETTPWQPGLCFGSRVDFHGWNSIWDCPMFDSLDNGKIDQIRNLAAFNDVLVFDLWAMTSDHRQAVFVRPWRMAGYVVEMIDHDLCFGGSNWGPARHPRHSLFGQPQVYKLVYGMDAFQPVIRRMRRKLRPSALKELAGQVPNEWISGKNQFDDLLARLNQRLGCLEGLIEELRDSTSDPFFNWLRLPVHCLHKALKDLTFEERGSIPPLRIAQDSVL
jgi:hypothetical protein